MIIPGSRFKKLQRTIAMLVERQDLPEGYTVMMDKIEKYILSKKAKRFAVDLLELVLSIVRREVELTIYSTGAGLAIVNLPITVRNIAIDVHKSGHIQVHLHYGPQSFVEQRVEGVLVYRYQTFQGVILIESKKLIGVKGETIVLRNDTMITINEVIY